MTRDPALAPSACLLPGAGTVGTALAAGVREGGIRLVCFVFSFCRFPSSPYFAFSLTCYLRENHNF